MCRNSAKLFFISVVFGLIWLTSCDDECEDCEVQYNEPYVNLEFKAYSFIDSLENETAELDTLIKEYEVAVDSLTGEDSVEIAETLSDLNDWSDSLETSLEDFEDGYATISITGSGANYLEAYQDTTYYYFKIPLNMNQDYSEIYFSYYQFQDTIRFVYDRDVYTDLDEIKMELLNLSIEYSSFDSIAGPSCDPSECRSDDITYEIYF